MKEILIILACVPLYAVNSFCDKIISVKSGNAYNYIYNCIKFLIGSLLLLPMFLTDGSPKFKLGALLCGVGCGIMYAISKTVILKGYERTSVAFMTLCHSAGMILPCILGHFFWSEPLSLFSAIGILLAVASIVLLKDGGKTNGRFGLSGILLGTLVFLASGGVMILQKLMGLYFTGESIGAYNFYSFVTAFLLIGILVRPVNNARSDIKAILLCAVGSALSLCIISLVMTALAGKVPSAILFPLFNGIGIISVCVGSVFAFGEKMTPRKAVGLILGVLGLCLVNL